MSWIVCRYSNGCNRVMNVTYPFTIQTRSRRIGGVLITRETEPEERSERSRGVQRVDS